MFVNSLMRCYGPVEFQGEVYFMRKRLQNDTEGTEGTLIDKSQPTVH